MARAAMRLKCGSVVCATAGLLASLSQASFTSAVGLSVTLLSLRRTLAASRRSSSYAPLKTSSRTSRSPDGTRESSPDGDGGSEAQATISRHLPAIANVCGQLRRAVGGYADRTV